MKIFLIASLFCSSLLIGEDSFEYVIDKADVKILNPTLAERKTAKIRLKNGLEAFLISDPKTDQSGAALAVEVGSWGDPKEYPGMAHFCEHMLFMGTQNYPDEAEYAKFIKDHGGERNAFTASDETVYMFSINNNAFKEALNRFAGFFIDPLFKTSSINQELKAVDQEHAKNIENDGWRQYMILKETGNPEHPNAGFSTGNAQTLGGIPREALVSWYNENYSSRRMHLVAISSLPMDELVQTVVSDFSSVPERNKTALSYPFELLSNQQKGHIIYIKPIKDIRVLDIEWQPPKEFAQDRDKNVFDLVSYALSYDGPGSLSEQLKKQQLAISVSSHAEQLSSDETLFELSVSLTEKGVKNLNAVIDLCFQAISGLKETGIPDYIFQESRQMALVNYQYQTRDNCFKLVQDLASDMIYEPLETFPEKQNIPSTYDPTFIKHFIETLTPENGIFFVQANPNLTNIPMTSKEKWMQAEYTIKPIAQEQLSAWANAPVNPAINLPEANPFIPKNLSLVLDSAPTIIAQDEGSLIYFKQDTQYQVPTGVSIFSLKSPLLNGSPASLALFDLYTRILQERLEGTLSLANAAGFSFKVAVQDLKMVLTLSGYTDKTADLLKTIFQSLTTLNPTKEQFDTYKEALLSSYQNSAKELPLRQGFEILNNLLSNSAPTKEASAEALVQISYESFSRFCKAAFKKAYVEGMIYGNFQESFGKELWTHLKSSLNYLPYPTNEQVVKQIIHLPEIGGPFLIETQTEMQGTGVILSIEEGRGDLQKRNTQQLLSTLISEDFFDTLRTKQQTGYIVQSTDNELENTLFQTFFVQSSSHSADDLLGRFEVFLNDFNQNLTQNLTLERFATLKSNLITLLEMPPENQVTMAVRLNMLAFKYTGDFERINKRIALLKKLSHEDTLKSANEFFSSQNSKRVAILVKGKMPSSKQDPSSFVNPLHYHLISPIQLKSLSTYTSKDP